MNIAPSNNLIIRYCVPILVVSFVLFLIYWLGFRDTWEIDNYTQIIDKCETLHHAIEKSHDNEAAQAHDELQSFIGDHEIELDFVVARVRAVCAAYDPVKARIEAARSERELKRRRKIVLADAGRQRKIAEEESRKEQEAIRRIRFKEQQDRRDEAGVFACEQIKDGLVSPSSANFTDVHIAFLKRQEVYYVTGTVDAQNSFGAMLRKQFTIFLRYRDNRWNDITDTLTHEEQMVLLHEFGEQLDRLFEAQDRIPNKAPRQKLWVE